MSRSTNIYVQSLRGARSGNPENAEAIGLSPSLWEFVEARWGEDRVRRPMVRVIVDIIRDAAARRRTLILPSSLPDGEGTPPA